VSLPPRHCPRIVVMEKKKMSRRHCLTKKVETGFGSVFLHVDVSDKANVKDVNISWRAKDENSALSEALYKISQGFRELIDEVHSDN
jgi:hypothetical protein